MLDLNPNQIFNQYQENKIDKSTAVKHLISIIEEYDNDDDRINSLRYLSQVELQSNEIYEFLEHLVLSDINENIREVAAGIIIKNYLEKGEKTLRWAIGNDKSVSVLLNILLELKGIENVLSKKLLSLMEESYSHDYIVKFNHQNIKPEESLLLKLLEMTSNIEIRLYDPYDLDGIFINFKEGYVNDLQIHYAKPPKLEFFKLFSRLKKLTIIGVGLRKIEGLENNSLEELDLSGNEITELSGLDKLPNLKSLNLSHNQIKELKNLENLKSLEILDLRGNEINQVSYTKIFKNLTLYFDDNPNLRNIK
jgi:Leucine-rich repeat (LRR) protein